ncbi:hypothetical protein PLCT2_00314 [Planctomycetaceae bacterium]|nr:hypothetical protein PLCT2_00314 [Planctomycetaceae bacterium]
MRYHALLWMYGIALLLVVSCSNANRAASEPGRDVDCNVAPSEGVAVRFHLVKNVSNLDPQVRSERVFAICKDSASDFGMPLEGYQWMGLREEEQGSGTTQVCIIAIDGCVTMIDTIETVNISVSSGLVSIRARFTKVVSNFLTPASARAYCVVSTTASSAGRVRITDIDLSFQEYIHEQPGSPTISKESFVQGRRVELGRK